MVGETWMAVRRSANERVRALARTVGEGRDEEWEFFCECGDSDCSEMVRLRTDAFDRLCSSRDGRILADGHPLARARAARELARDLHESARALRAQAEHAVGRRQPRQRRLRVSVALDEDGLLDAGEDAGRLLEDAAELDLSPASVELIIALDEALAREAGQSSSGRSRSRATTASRTASGRASAQSASRSSSALPPTPPAT